MPVSRRTLLATAAAAVPALALATPATAQPAPDLSTPEGWLNWISAHREGLGLVIDDGRGGVLAHRAHAAQPLASSIKVVHLAAYAEAVAEGRLDPAEQVRVGDWERYYVPTDGGAHVAALGRLGIPTDPTGLHAADPEHRVALEQMVDAMIRFSDSAAPDFLRDRLGLPALVRAARNGGWPDPDLRSLCAEYLFLALPEHAPPAWAPAPLRRRLGFRLERRYRDDPALRARTLERLTTQPLPPWDAQCAWGDGTMAAPASSLAAIHRAIATGRSKAAGIAREVLERPLQGHLPPGVIGIGNKGGSLPGILTCGLSVRREDGGVGFGGLVAHGDIGPDQVAKGDPAGVLLMAILDPAWRDRLARALRG
ncbi:serine hydrolase [Saccharopolyspora taberi]|uniref:Beta-lactamase n=1 Tax=Saccharopolyspora taberi TaxID=60895 RepID=A0ABN3VF69_9PSEU